MSADPERFFPAARDRERKPPRHAPNLADTAIFLLLATILLILTQSAAFALAMGLHLFGKEPAEQLLREPRLLIPAMAASYLLTGAIAWAIFAALWHRPFLSGICWNAAAVRRLLSRLLAFGVAPSVSVQLLSNYLPIPKALPIDDFFRSPADVWLVAVFGAFLAPVLEELAFRGFLLPSLAWAWDWVAARGRRAPVAATGESGDAHQAADGGLPVRGQIWTETPRPDFADGPMAPGDPEAPRAATPTGREWSVGALIASSILTSIAFALLHADQLAHAWAPLAVLFCVSIVLCLVRVLTRSLAASALVHAAYNATIFTLMFFASDGFRHLDKIK